jgi:hypothetical protein
LRESKRNIGCITDIMFEGTAEELKKKQRLRNQQYLPVILAKTF